MPMWIADYVLVTYGTGAIMAVPAHDERDYDFAKTFDLPIVEVVKGGNIEEEPYVEDGEMVNSDFLNGLRSEEHTSELQSRGHLVCRLLLEKKKSGRRRGRSMWGVWGARRRRGNRSTQRRGRGRAYVRLDASE